ncbi:phytanoyl-CoA dioxygenase family protein [Phenylobacterium sp.]|uniref:phytanoyl-CoA dioxygenase family protein n=1 Tax=Phenylobacterium sp. TaxID=1871053 RepID=UPI002F3FAEE5
MGSAAARRIEALWLRAKGGQRRPLTGAERNLDRIALNTLGVAPEEWRDVLQRFEAVEDLLAWSDARAGGVDSEGIARFEAMTTGAPPPDSVRRRIATIEAAEPVLDAAALRRWQADGYVVVPAVISPDEVQALAEVVWACAGADRDEPDSWRLTEHGIMVQLFQHPALEPARTSPRLLKAFAQVWGSADLWTSLDRVSFNPPVRPGVEFPGPRLHWDISLVPPVVFQVQGMIYLTDTGAEQGAFEVVPGFHRGIDAWLEGLGDGVDPRRVDLSAQARRVAANAGDLIIWHSALPHGASPNTGDRPRLAQYVTQYPSTLQMADRWR